MSDIRTILQSIYNQRGELTPVALVEEARPVDHPLHNRFEWDDDAAAERYREIQAAHLIRAVRISYTDHKGDKQTVREWTARRVASTPDEYATGAYDPTEEVLTDPIRRALLLREMDREWKTLRARYSHLREFAELVLGDMEKAS